MRDLATILETGEASRALADGDRAGAEAVLSLADRLRGLLQAAEQCRDAACDNAPRDASAPSRVESRGPRVVRRAMSKRTASRTEFHRSGSQIVKLGMVGTAKAYRHFAPISLVARVASVAEGLMRDRGEFGFDDVSAALPDDKGYQVRLVIAWMRSVSALTDRTKGRYLAEPDLPARIASALQDLEQEREVAVGATRSRRKSTRKKTTGRRNPAKRATAA